MLPTYNGILLQFEDHFEAWVPDVMGAYSCGATAEEASSEVREQLYTVLKDLSRSGCTFPQPSSASLAQRKARNILLELQELGEAPQVVLSQTTLVVTPHYQDDAAACTGSAGALQLRLQAASVAQGFS
eukprot:gene19733-26425_t